MGRPRKRRRSDANASKNLPPIVVVPNPLELGAVDQYDQYHMPTYPDAGSLPFATHTNGGSAGADAKWRAEDRGEATILQDESVVWHFGSSEMVNQSIDFGGMAETNLDIALPSITTSSLGGIPEAPFDSKGSGPMASHSHQPPCSCLAAMYLSMAALQELPSDFSKALSVVRTAAKTAHEVIHCNSCRPNLTFNPKIPAAGFQNTMLLGTIFPLIVEGYARLLTLIDEETARSALAGQKKRLDFKDYGVVHLWGTCIEPYVTDGEISPGEWRTLVRAVLRYDIYGHESTTNGVVSCSQGLQGIIAEMEERQKRRHDQMAQLKAAGLWTQELEAQNCVGTQEPQKTEHHFCLQMIETAKKALSSLCIA